MTDDYVLADDLSGALEVGAAFWARGRRVRLQMEEGGAIPAEHGAVSLYSTETRNLTGDAAAMPVRQLLARQRSAGAELLFKKIDSTLRGPIAVELKAIIEEIAPPLVVVCPANPVVGRTVRDGVLLVEGTPVSDTEFRRDPGWPVAESRIVSILSSGGVEQATELSLARLRTAVRLESNERSGVLVSDAENEEDLARLVALVRRQEPRAVFVGAGGLAHALAAATQVGSQVLPVAQIDPKTVLVVSGSLSERSRRQVELLRDVHQVPLHEVALKSGSEYQMALHLELSLRTKGCAVLTLVRDARPAESGEPVRKLAAVTRLLAASGSIPELLAVTGGETARVLCAALGIRRLDLMGEIEPGVVLSSSSETDASKPAYLVIKPGAFGSPQLWSKLIRAKCSA